MMQIMFQMQLSFMAGAVLLLCFRPLLGRFPRALSYALWCIVFLRLACPLSLETGLPFCSMPNMGNIAGKYQQTDYLQGKAAQDTESSRTQRDDGERPIQPGQDSTGEMAQTETGVSNQNSKEGAVQGGAVKSYNRSGEGDAGNDISGDGNLLDVAGGSVVDPAENGNLVKEGPGAESAPGRNAQKENAGFWGQSFYGTANKFLSVMTDILAVLYHWMEMHASSLAAIWILGIGVYLSVSFYNVRKFGYYVREATPCTDGGSVYESGQIASPFVFGIRQKKIILPHGLSEEERKYIICHEEMHLRRRDDLVKWMVFVLNGIYWFQPFAWVAAYCLEQDMEMSCDEMVIRKMGHQIKKSYAQSLLSFAGGRTQEMLPPAFASGSVKSRIRNVLRAKHSRKWMLPVSLVLILSFAVILFTVQRNQAGRPAGSFQESRQAAETMPTATADRLDEEMPDASGKEESREQAIENNFGKFFYRDDAQPDYETYLSRQYQKYRFDNILFWKDKDHWCYPKKYKFSFVTTDHAVMAAQQFPPELLEAMDTEELLSFILSGKKDLTWGGMLYDNYLQFLCSYYQQYNYIHELMNRQDCAAAVHQRYQRFSEDEIQRYSRSESQYAWQHSMRVTEESTNFKLVEALEWFFMALEGKKVPNEAAYGLELEKTLDDPMLPQEYVFQEDVTHDGIKDTITLHMEALRDESLATGEEETVTVTSGKTGKKIASYTADTVHYGWNGIYLYEDKTGKYLVEWKPAMYQGVGAFSLRVFSLGEDGTENVLTEKKFKFNLNSNKFDFDRKAYRNYIDFVNTYLKNSYVIVDTDQGEVQYSTKEGQLSSPYDGSWVIEDVKEMTTKKKVEKVAR